MGGALDARGNVGLPGGDGARVCVVEEINRQVFEDDLLKTILE